MPTKSKNKVVKPEKLPRAPTQAQVLRELETLGEGSQVSQQQLSKDWIAFGPFKNASDYLEKKAKNEQREPRKTGGNAVLAQLREEKIRAEIAVLKERHISEQRENRKRDGELVEISLVHSQQDKCVAKARAVLTQKFETELPPKLDGMPAEKIAEANRSALDEVFSILSKKETYA